MGEKIKKTDDIAVFIEDREYIANTYVLRCFRVTMIIYALAFGLNLLGIFVIDQRLMYMGFIPSLIIYFVVDVIAKRISLSDERAKYFILLTTILVYTIMGVTITYHVVLVSVLPFLYATLYSSKRLMMYVYIFSVISAATIVYGGYYFGLCDANMALLTTGTMESYLSNGYFALTEVNSNPYLSLMLFFVVPRCLIYIAVYFVCSNIFRIVSGSIEKAKLTAELEKAKEEAENANRSKSQFLARMSHEIRTPINSIIGMNEMILRESKEKETRKYAHDIKHSSNTLLSLVNEILDSSKIESGKMEIVPVNYELGSLMNNLYNMISIKAKDKGLQLVFNIAPDIPSEYFGDDIRIRQVLVNLLTNGVKYTDEGTVTMTVTGRTEGENEILHFSVKDTGIGIKEENIKRIFSQFERIEDSRNHYVEGTGLGMNIAMQLLALMGSELKVESQFGKGSEFYFDIVQKIINQEPLGDIQKRFADVEKDNGIRKNYIVPEAKILVVDDNDMNRRVFKGLLRKTQAHVFEAGSGAECLSILEKQDVDIVFLDHMMPVMDGVETFHAIKEKKLCENTPIIMLTANAIIGAKEQYLQEGFNGYLSKPIMPDKLDEMLMEYLPEGMIVNLAVNMVE